MLVEKNIDGADDVVQVGLYEDPEHTELNALQVSMDLLGHETCFLAYLGLLRASKDAQRHVC